MYEAPITRTNPMLFLFLIDRSGSMAQTIMYDGERMKKSEVVARVVNQTIDGLLYRCRKGSGYQNYFNIAVLGYNDKKVYSLLDGIDNRKKIFSVVELAEASVPQRSIVKRRKSASGEYVTINSTVNMWVEPCNKGNTPTYEAMTVVFKEVLEWLGRRNSLDCFPPVVLQMSDGEVSDSSKESLIELAARLKSITTNDGNLLLINTHLASEESESLLFPSSEQEIDSSNGRAQLLYRMSSDMPQVFHEDISAIKKIKYQPGITTFRGVAYNASVADIVKVLSVGTSTIR